MTPRTGEETASSLDLRDGSLALLNILEDSEAEKRSVADGQRALLNILDDAAQERDRIDLNRLALLNILEDSAQEKAGARDGQKALLNILDDLDGERARVNAANTDLQTEVFEHTLAEQALHERTDELARSNADLEMFAYAASHDLSEPLRAISGPISLLARRYEGVFDDEARELIGFVVDGCHRMQSLIDDLLTYSRVGRVDLERAPVDCAVAVNDVLATLASAIAEKRTAVQVGPLPVVTANPTALRQVLQNLIANAVKFSARTEAPAVSVTCAAAGEGWWRICVSDNGIGIKPEHRDRIFGLFKRLHTRDDYPGTGVGLALVKKIVEQHGGEIGIQDGPNGIGAAFWFTVPAEET